MLIAQGCNEDNYMLSDCWKKRDEAKSVIVNAIYGGYTV